MFQRERGDSDGVDGKFDGSGLTLRGTGANELEFLSPLRL